MSFEWTDRAGAHHTLDNPAPIIVEGETLAREIDRLVVGVESTDTGVRDAARRIITRLMARLDACNANLDRWNAHADAQTRVAADELIERIEALPNTIKPFVLVVGLHDEHDQMLEATSGAAQTRADVLAGRATVAQRRAFMAIDIRSMPPETMTRSEAKAALDADPRFARENTDTGGWFAWTDRYGHAHLLVSPLQIEREIVAVAGELTALLPALRDHERPDALFATANACAASWSRIQILEYDLERFECEADARDLTQCKQFAADWRSKRNR